MGEDDKNGGSNGAKQAGEAVDTAKKAAHTAKQAGKAAAGAIQGMAAGGPLGAAVGVAKAGGLKYCCACCSAPVIAFVLLIGFLGSLVTGWFFGIDNEVKTPEEGPGELYTAYSEAITASLCSAYSDVVSEQISQAIKDKVAELEKETEDETDEDGNVTVRHDVNIGDVAINDEHMVDGSFELLNDGGSCSYDIDLTDDVAFCIAAYSSTMPYGATATGDSDDLSDKIGNSLTKNEKKLYEVTVGNTTYMDSDTTTDYEYDEDGNKVDSGEWKCTCCDFTWDHRPSEKEINDHYDPLIQSANDEGASVFNEHGREGYVCLIDAEDGTGECGDYEDVEDDIIRHICTAHPTVAQEIIDEKINAGEITEDDITDDDGEYVYSKLNDAGVFEKGTHYGSKSKKSAHPYDHFENFEEVTVHTDYYEMEFTVSELQKDAVYEIFEIEPNYRYLDLIFELKANRKSLSENATWAVREANYNEIGYSTQDTMPTIYTAYGGAQYVENALDFPDYAGDTVEPGQSITYTIMLWNPTKTPKHVTIKDEIDTDVLTYVTSEGDSYEYLPDRLDLDGWTETTQMYEDVTTYTCDIENCNHTEDTKAGIQQHIYNAHGSIGGGGDGTMLVDHLDIWYNENDPSDGDDAIYYTCKICKANQIYNKAGANDGNEEIGTQRSISSYNGDGDDTDDLEKSYYFTEAGIKEHMKLYHMSNTYDNNYNLVESNNDSVDSDNKTTMDEENMDRFWEETHVGYTVSTEEAHDLDHYEGIETTTKNNSMVFGGGAEYTEEEDGTGLLTWEFDLKAYQPAFVYFQVDVTDGDDSALYKEAQIENMARITLNSIQTTDQNSTTGEKYTTTSLKGYTYETNISQLSAEMKDDLLENGDAITNEEYILELQESIADTVKDEEGIEAQIVKVNINGADNATYSGTGYNDSRYNAISGYMWPLENDRNIATVYSSDHKGIDIDGDDCCSDVDIEVPVYAANDGTIVAVGYNDHGWNEDKGSYVEIDHGDGYITEYWNLCEDYKDWDWDEEYGDVYAGGEKEVKQGEIIGYICKHGGSSNTEGDSGKNGGHLHFAVKFNGSYVNPMETLFVTNSATEGEAIIVNNADRMRDKIVEYALSFVDISPYIHAGHGDTMGDVTSDSWNNWSELITYLNTYKALPDGTTWSQSNQFSGLNRTDAWDQASSILSEYDMTMPYIFDCSGFTWWVYYQFGIDLGPQTTTGECKYGYEVSYDEMKKGDLIFTWSTNPGSVEHVIMYIGDGQYVSASKPGTLIGTGDVSWYKNDSGGHIITIRRIID